MDKNFFTTKIFFIKSINFGLHNLTFSWLHEWRDQHSVGISNDKAAENPFQYYIDKYGDSGFCLIEALRCWIAEANQSRSGRVTGFLPTSQIDTTTRYALTQ